MMQVPSDKLPGKTIDERKFHIKIIDNVNRGLSILIIKMVTLKNIGYLKRVHQMVKLLFILESEILSIIYPT